MSKCDFCEKTKACSLSPSSCSFVPSKLRATQSKKRFDDRTILWFRSLAIMVVTGIFAIVGAHLVYLDSVSRGGDDMADREIRRCGCGWEYCAGECQECSKSSTYATNSTSERECTCE